MRFGEVDILYINGEGPPHFFLGTGGAKLDMETCANCGLYLRVSFHFHPHVVHRGGSLRSFVPFGKSTTSNESFLPTRSAGDSATPTIVVEATGLEFVEERVKYVRLEKEPLRGREKDLSEVRAKVGQAGAVIDCEI